MWELTIKKVDHQSIDAFKWWCWKRLLKVHWAAGRSSQSILKDQAWILIRKTDAKAEASVLWLLDVTLWKRPWCWDRLKARGEGNDRGWDEWMASLIQWSWVLANSGRLWCTGKPRVLQGSKGVRYVWATEQQLLHPSRAKANRVLPKECIGHSKCPLPTTQEKTLQGHHQMVNTEIRLIIFCSQRQRSSIQSEKTRSGAACGSDHELLIVKFRLKLKKAGKTNRSLSYDLNQISYDYTVEETNRFKELNVIDRVHEELWTEVHDIVSEAVIKTIPKKKKGKKTKWLSEETLQIV